MTEPPPSLPSLSPSAPSLSPSAPSPPSLSIVIPAYNEARRISSTLEAAISFLDARAAQFELIVVDDGSVDDTCSVVDRLSRSDPRIHLLALARNQGKGAAVRRGMLTSQGARVLFMDADLATPMTELDKLTRALDEGADVAIGSRGTPESQVRRSQGVIRETMGKTFNRIVQALVLSGIQDTQCGFKLFTAEASKRIFSGAEMNRFAFDVEILLLAHHLGLRVVEIPIAWRHVPDSRVSPFLDAARMLFDVTRLRLRLRKKIVHK